MLFFRQLHFEQMGAVTDDRVQRGAQFMADAGKEQAFGLVCGLGFFFCLRDFGDQRRAICRYHYQADKQPDRKRRAVAPKVDMIDGPTERNGRHNRGKIQPFHAKTKAVAQDDPEQGRIYGGKALATDLEEKSCRTEIDA